VADAEGYQIQVDEAGFSSPEWDEIVAGTEYTPGSGLSGGVYTWRVRAVNGGGAGAWSARWAFSAPTASPPGFEVYLPVVAREYR
jgi:hypothetical protein